MLWHLSMETLSVEELVKSESVLFSIISNHRYTVTCHQPSPLLHLKKASAISWSPFSQCERLQSSSASMKWKGFSRVHPAASAQEWYNTPFTLQHCSTWCQQLQAELAVTELIVCWVWWLILVWDSGALQTTQKTFWCCLQTQRIHFLYLKSCWISETDPF